LFYIENVVNFNKQKNVEEKLVEFTLEKQKFPKFYEFFGQKMEKFGRIKKH